MYNHSESINERVSGIKGNKVEINRLIEEYKPFIASVVEGAIGKYVRYGEDDELSIGLIAFEEAIKCFNESKGNFLVFAKNVIKRRLIDYYRKEKKHINVIPLIDNSPNSQSDDEIDLGSYESIKLYSDEQTAENRRTEIKHLKCELEKWGLTFFDVAKSSPKQEGTRRSYMQIINCIINNTEILEIFKKKRYLAIAEIQKSLKIPRKKIERGRNYIIAVVLVKIGDFESLNSFVDLR